MNFFFLIELPDIKKHNGYTEQIYVSFTNKKDYKQWKKYWKSIEERPSMLYRRVLINLEHSET